MPNLSAALSRKPALALATLLGALACNSLLDIPEGHLSAARDCVLNSDCTSGQVCVFRVCSPPCKADLDCSDGSRCLSSDNGIACVRSQAATCTTSDDCEGATCSAGMCRTACKSSADCLNGQTCAEGSCFGTDPNHDSPISSGGSSGKGGASSGGVGGSAGTNSFTNGGTSGGTSNMSGGSAGAGAGGEGGESEPPRDCTTSDTRCNTEGKRETCSVDGHWGTPTDCPFLCSGKDCGGECVPDTKECLMGTTPHLCGKDGTWTTGDPCPAVCVDGACKASCNTGDSQCSGKDVMKCSAQGKFELDQTCKYLCDPTTKTCTGECEPTTQRCDGVKLQTCGADAKWQTLATCPALCTAKPGSPGQFECSGDCSPTTKKCADASTLEVCNGSGKWDSTNCASSNKTCFAQNNVAGCYGSCAPNQQQCTSNKVQACSATGTYQDSQTCVNTTCTENGTSASCTGVCAPGQQQCTSNKVQACSAGKYVDSTDCTPLNKACVESGNTASCGGMCIPTAKACINNDAYACNDSGTQVLTNDCAAPDEICNSGACIPNDPYSVGNASSAGYTNFDVPDNQWYLVKITPPNDATVLGLRLIGRSSAGIARMGLWKDSGGAPGAFVAQTDNITMAAGTVSDAPVPLATKVTGGQVYWVGAKFVNGAQIYQKSTAGQTGYVYDHAFATVPSALNPFPSGAADTFTNVSLNFYLLVQDVSL